MNTTNTETNAELTAIKTETIQDVMRAKFTPLRLTKEYTAFLGTPPADAQFSIALIGEPGSGKSVFSLKLAKEFSRLKLGNILIACPEEHTKRGNQRKRLPVAGVSSSSTGIEFANINKYGQLQQLLKTNTYKFCFIDSVNTFTDADDKQVAQIQKEFPDVNFIYVVQLTKDRKSFRGFYDWEHNTDIPIRFFCNDDNRCWAENIKSRMGNTEQLMYLYTKKEQTLADGSTSNSKGSKKTKVKEIKSYQDYKYAQLRKGKGIYS